MQIGNTGRYVQLISEVFLGHANSYKTVYSDGMKGHSHVNYTDPVASDTNSDPISYK
jgi:hypothetical protein